MPPAAGRAPALLAAAALFITPLLLAAPLLLRGVPVFGHDNGMLWLPICHYTGTSLADGRLPLWCPHYYGGFPYFAGYQTALLYPPTWLCALLPAAAAVTTLTIGHLALAEAAAYLCARRFGAPRAGAVVAGLAYGLGGFAVGHAFGGHLPILQGMAWVPALLAASDRLRERPGPGRAAAAAACVALLVLAGSAQVALYGLLLEAAVAAAALARRSPGRARAAGAEALALACGIALAAPQILPTAALTRESARAASLSGAWVAEHTLHPGNLALLVAPDARGAPLHPFGPDFDTRKARAFPDSLGRTGYWWEQVGHVGMVPIFLAAAALARRPDRRTAALAAAGAVALAGAVAIGPLVEAGGAVGGWLAAPFTAAGRIRAPVRLLLVVGLATALLAGEGARRLLSVTPDEARFLGIRAALGTGGFLAATLGVAQLAEPGGLRAGALAAGLLPGAASVGLASVGLARGALGAAAAGAVLVAGAVLDFAPPALRTLVGFPKPDSDTLLRGPGSLPGVLRESGGPARVSQFSEYPVFNSGLVSGLEKVEGFDPMVSARFLRVVDRILAEPPSDTRILLYPGQVFERCGEPAAARWLDLLNVRYLLSDFPPPWKAEPPGLRTLTEPGRLPALFERPTALPRAWLAGGVRFVPPGEIHEAVENPALDPRGVALLEDEYPPNTFSDLPGRPGPAGEVIVLPSDRPERLVLEVRADRPAMAVLSVPWSPDWTAAIGPVEVPIFRTYGFLMAVPVYEKSCRIEFRYSPDGLGLGLALASMAGAALVLWSAVARGRGSPA
ncbi:MAG: hypothetical protein L0216_00395 [Planctomycetales bacterium]|nr:hypothetical protein [Planctomycetales bacterium]